jgi:protease-4
MVISTDILLERIKLKSAVRRWRGLAIGGVTLLIIVLVAGQFGLKNGIPSGNHIARLNVKNMILIDRDRAKAIQELSEDVGVKAVIVAIDSPGGTAAGGESLYYSLKALNEKKPVVVVMENMATSAGYLVAMPSDRIFAHKATITGSIGVLLQSPNIGKLIEKVGVEMNFIKTGPLKAAPNMFEPMTPESEAVMQALVDDFYNVFVDTIDEHRDLTRAEVIKLADGRVYSGLQAVDNGLVDAIGIEKDAIVWLEENKEVQKDLKVIDVKYGTKKSPFEKLMKTLSGENILPKEFTTHGLMAMWNNTFTQ